MEKEKNLPGSIDEYIRSTPPAVQGKLRAIRAAIKEEAPDAIEKFSYQMPTFALNGNLVHYAAFKNHIGFYPAPSGIEHFTDELARYQTSKGAIQFPLDEEIPLDLIRQIVRFRVQENLQKKKQT